MGETKQQLKERLQAAGLWHEFVTVRDQLAKDGLTPAQARAEALHQVESRPKPGEAPRTETRADHVPGALIGEPAAEQSLPDFTRHVPNDVAVRWTAENLANPGVRAQDAPSSLAWGLLAWARLSPSNQSTFWGSIWSKTLPTGAALKRQQPNATDERDPVHGLVAELLAKCKQDAERRRTDRTPSASKG